MQKKMYVVFCENDGTYWCGFNKWDKQLRKAKVFQSLKYANELHRRFDALKLKNVEIRIDLVTDNLNNADRIRAMSDEELEEVILRLSIGYEPWCDHHCKMNGDDDCNRCLRIWLQQPAKDG